jgi:hypothetical protein
MRPDQIAPRAAIAILAGAALASCSTAPPQPTRTAQGQQQFERLIAGKIPGKPTSCLPSYDQNDMTVIDDSTIAYRQGSRQVYINHMQGSCSGLGRGSTALVTRSFSSQTCRGDIARVVDTASRMMVGSCVFGDFIPYSAPPRR